ncbi:MAG: DMT family transporter [Clostridia bacterium]|nr:DMT family transporter [Clostridia bacterium]
MTKELKADLMLLFVAVSWGASNYVISLCMADMSPLSVNIFRFGIGAVTVGLIGIKTIKKINWITVKYALAMSIFLTLSYLCTNLGIERTTISNSGFYCALSVLFLPFAEWAIFKMKPDRKLAVVIAMSIVGIFLLSLTGDFTFNRATLFGDFLCTLTAVAVTFNVLICDKAVMHEDVNAFNLGFLQIAFTFLWSTGLSFLLETPSAPSNVYALLGLVFLGVICTGVALVIQPVAQQYTTGTHVALIFALEPVFCAIIAFFFAHEVLCIHNYIGMILLLAGIVLLEVDLKKAS